MNFKIPYAAISLATLAWSCGAYAGDTPIYDAAPEWVQTVDVDEVDEGESNYMIVSDRQIRIEDGKRLEYSDTVYRISTLADLSKVGTLTARWFPDKGDLIVHEISITRDGEVIDVVDQGEELEVLRRERLLERRIIDGSLTATLAVPGLQVGDQLRMRYTVTNSDQALGREVQSQTLLWREPAKGRGGVIGVMLRGLTVTKADFARVLVSWSDDLDVAYQAGPNFELDEVELRDGYNWLEVELPLPKADRLPRDAPLRYRTPTMLQVGTFSDWDEVSSVMAPYYETSGALKGVAELEERADAIANAYPTQLEQAVAALELVQEDIRYLMNGLDGGNYLPQDVATTWEKKFGDCKAKTVMLLALLNRLGIQSEAVLVSSRRGNAVPLSLPLPGAFDHVLVRAIIDGQEYFLDGTTIGANIKTVGNVPPFEYYLPIQSEGASLQRLEQTLPRFPEAEIEIVHDSSAGADLPVLGTIRVTTVGARAAQMNANEEKLTDAAKRAMARRLGRGVQMVDFAVEQGDDDSEATVTITGIMPPMFNFDGIRADYSPTALTNRGSFAPDRSRPKWREIPVVTRKPSTTSYSLRAIMPAVDGEFEITGDQSMDIEAARTRFIRETEWDGSEIRVFEQVTNLGGEIPVDQLRAERRNVARLEGEELSVTAPKELPRRWRFAGNPDRTALRPLEDAYAKVISQDPEDADPYIRRAKFRARTFDFDGALADYTKAIEFEATANLYSRRGWLHRQLLDAESAKADFEEAFLLDPSTKRAIALAYAMADLGDITGAQKLLSLEDGDRTTRENLAIAMAKLDARLGDPRKGLSRIAEKLEDYPNDSRLLNSMCRFIGTWRVQLDDGDSICTKAVESGGKAARVLDTRAMFYLRTGALDKALADIDQALDLAPEQSGSLLLRGLIRVEQGDPKGKDDIDSALARMPSLAQTFGRWGFEF